MSLMIKWDNKLKKHKEHIRFMSNALKHFDFNTQFNTGIFTNKIRLITHSGEFLFTKKQLADHVERAKANLKRYMEEV